MISLRLGVAFGFSWGGILRVVALGREALGIWIALTVRVGLRLIGLGVRVGFGRMIWVGLWLEIAFGFGVRFGVLIGLWIWEGLGRVRGGDGLLGWETASRVLGKPNR